jgi:pimeloyl-ACP methyl ester carboxylesterase
MITVLLVHGAWTDGSSWHKVIPRLQAKGLKVQGVQLPLTSLADDAAATKRLIADIPGPILLVGHSWGGTVITQAGDDPKVVGLVYVAAFAPDVGETGNSLIAEYPKPPALSTVLTDTSGNTYLSTEGVLKNFAPDVPVEEANTMAVVQGRLAGKTFGESVSVAAWKTRPTWYVVSADDRVVSPELETAAAKRMKAKTTVLHSSHVSILSHSTEVAAVIEEAARSVANSNR